MGLFTDYTEGTKQEEVTQMKQTSFMNKPFVNVPNAATRREVLHQMLDRILVAVSCLGLITAIAFFLSLS